MNLSGILYPLIPAVYAWQVYGFWIGASVFMAVALLLITLTCFNMNRGWVRLFVLILSCVAIGLSAAQTCDANHVCQSSWVMK